MRRVKAAALAGILAFGLFGATARLHAQGPREGIKVHGHWAIDVRNPDGTLASHTEFENGLTMGGATLVSLLSHHSSLSAWSIQFAGPCGNSGLGIPVPCTIVETGGVANATTDANLRLSGNLTGGTLTLAGVFQARTAGVITAVSTGTSSCIPELSATDCHNQFVAGFAAFSGTGLASPISVVASQMIQFTVTISFS